MCWSKQASSQITDLQTQSAKKNHFLCNHLAKSDSLPPFLTKRRVVDSQLPISHVGLSLSLSLSLSQMGLFLCLTLLFSFIVFALNYPPKIILSQTFCASIFLWFSLSNGSFSLSHSLIFFYCFCLKLPTKNHFVSNILCFYLSLVLSLLFNLGKQPFFLSLFLCLTLFHYLNWKNTKTVFLLPPCKKILPPPPFLNVCTKR